MKRLNSRNSRVSDDTLREAGRHASKITLGFLAGSILYLGVSSLLLGRIFADPSQIASWEITKEAIYVALAAAALYYSVKRGLAGIAEAREQLHHVINNMPGAFFSLDGDRHFTFLNKKAAEIYDRPPEDMIGRPLSDFTSVENSRVMGEFLDNAIAAQKVSRERMRAPVTGGWYELTAYPRGPESSVFLHNVTERRAAEDRMRHLSLAIDNMTDAFYVIDKSERFLIVNRSVADYYGKASEDLVGESIWPYVAPHNVPSLRRMVEAARKTGRVQRDQMGRSNQWFQVAIYPSGEELLISFQDITQAHQADLQLAQKVREQSALAKFSVAAFQAVDTAQVKQEAADLARATLAADSALVVHVSPDHGAATLVGAAGLPADLPTTFKIRNLPESTMVRALLREIKPVRLSHANAMSPTTAGFLPESLGFRSGGGAAAQCADGSIMMLMTFSNEAREFTEADDEFIQTMVNMIAALRDRRHAHETLHLRDRALEAITQGISIAEVKGEVTSTIYTNSAFLKMTGFAAHELLGKGLELVFPRGLSPELEAESMAAYRERRPLLMETNLTRKDRSTFIDRMISAPITDARGNVTHFVSVHEDITEARQRDERLHESQKMEAVGQLTGGIAHDFNNLLTVVRANAEDMRDELKDSPLLHRQADMVLQAATRGADLVQQLMAFARKQELEPKVVDPNAMLDAFTKLVRRTLRENVDMEVIKGKNVPAVKVDPGRLENSILNLSINARDAMPEGGMITIETGTVTLDAAYVLENPGVRAGTYVLIAVSDTGTGMTKDVVEKAFQPFFTTKEVGQGTGLGLSMVYGFVKQSGGHAKIYSEIGHGTTVKIFLPPTQESLLDGAAAEERAVQTAGSEKVLLVEDDDLVRQSVESKLLRMGYAVTPVCSAAEAIRMLEQNPYFDLVFTDVIMPGAMTGADLARDVMRRWPGIKVLMTSGYTEASALGKVKLPEGVRLLSKPYSNADLSAAFRDALEPVPAA
ncbi:MAG: PAS domain S-box protein [Rhodospirillaceae bacterium]|nr:PAS domain S-box protein [Rhodospirillaceae bacterium]